MCENGIKRDQVRVDHGTRSRGGDAFRASHAAPLNFEGPDGSLLRVVGLARVAGPMAPRSGPTILSSRCACAQRTRTTAASGVRYPRAAHIVGPTGGVVLSCRPLSERRFV